MGSYEYVDNSCVNVDVVVIVGRIVRFLNIGKNINFM